MKIASFDKPYLVELENISYAGTRVLVHRPLAFVTGDGYPVFRIRGWTVTHRVSGQALVIFRYRRNAMRLARLLEDFVELDYHRKSARRSCRLIRLVVEEKRLEDYAVFMKKLSRSHVGEAAHV